MSSATDGFDASASAPVDRSRQGYLATTSDNDDKRGAPATGGLDDARRRVRTVAAMLLICAAGWGLRLFWLGRQSLWYDEALSVSQAQLPLSALVPELAQHDVHPPLYFSLLHGWIGGAGISEFAVRALSAWWSTLVIVALFALGTRLAGRRVGIIGAGVGAFSPLLVYYGQETRMYALLAALATLSAYAVVRAATGEDRWWPAYVALQAAALWTQLYAALLFLALNVWYVAWYVAAQRQGATDGPRVRRWMPPARWAISQVAAVAIFSPWVPVALQRSQTYLSPGYGAGSAFATILQQTALVFALGVPVGYLLGTQLPAYVALIPWLILLALGLVAACRQRLWLLPCWLLVPMVGIYLLSLGKRDFIARYLIEAWPPFALLCALGIAWCLRTRVRRPLGAVLGLALAGATVITLHDLYTAPAYARDDNRAAVQLVAAAAAPGAGIVVDTPNFASAFPYYARGRWALLHLPLTLPASAATTLPPLAVFAAGHPQIWLMLWQEYLADPNRLVWTWLLQHRYLAAWTDVHGGIRVLRFDSLPPGGSSAVPAHFADTLALVGLQTIPAPQTLTEEQRHVTVDLFWHVLRQPAANDAIVLQVLNHDGMPIAGTQEESGATPFPMSTWRPGDGYHSSLRLTIPTDTGSEGLRLAVLVYDPDTLRELPASGSNAAGLAVLVPLSLPAGTVATPPSREAKRIGAQFAGVGTLAGYQVLPSKKGVVVALSWQATATPSRAYKVFVHALNASGGLLAAADSEPAGGAAPTTGWLPGEPIWDLHRLPLPASAIAAYEVGLYDPQTGMRVPVRLAGGAMPKDDAVRFGANPALGSPLGSDRRPHPR
ncbi:MAG: glycosyltransferase family 39 protein [Chloroflexota bacterium]